MISTPKVSIIIPVYKVEKYIDRCIQSVINQTLKEIEIILIDDGSPDRCPRICDAYAIKDKRIKVIHKNNEGLGFARNSGIKIATGDYIAFVDSDDYIEPNMYSDLIEIASKFTLDTVFCGYFRENNNHSTQISEVEKITFFNNEEITNVFLANMIATDIRIKKERQYAMSVWRGIYSKRIIDKYHILFPSEREYISEDIIFHIDYLSHSRHIAISPNSFYHYILNETSLTQLKRNDRFEKYKILYFGLIHKAKEKNLYEILGHRIDKLFIGYCRSLTYNIIKSTDNFRHKLAALQIICHDNIWEQINENYPIKMMPLQNRVIFNLTYHNHSLILYCFIKIYIQINRK